MLAHLKKGFITPEGNERLPFELRSTRGLLTLAYTPSGRYIARKARDAYNGLLAENGSGDENQLDFLPIKHRQFAEGELVPRLEESVDGRDVFLFASLYDPSHFSDGLEALHGAMAQRGLLHEGVTLDTFIHGASDGQPPLRKMHDEWQSRKALNANLMELFLYIRTLAENNARHIVAVVPYFAYERQNHPTPFQREATLARLAADLIVAAGADGIIGYDPHADDIKGFFPPDHNFTKKFVNPLQTMEEVLEPYVTEDTAFAFLDKGCVDRYHELARELGLGERLIYVDKVRRKGAEIVGIKGYEKGMRRILYADDIAATLTTAEGAQKKLFEMGAQEFIGTFSHGLFTADAAERLVVLHRDYGLKAVHITDSIPQPLHIRSLDFIHEKTLGRVFAKIVNAVHYQASASQHSFQPNS